MVKPYRPHPSTAAVLDRALELVQSVPYQVSLRWLFYGLLQEGVFQSKADYITLKGITSKARKRLYNGWNPDTLADDTRRTYTRRTGYFDEADFLEAVGDARCVLDKWRGQDYYIELWYEAKAMHGQFTHYTKHITLRPFGGDPSITSGVLRRNWSRHSRHTGSRLQFSTSATWTVRDSPSQRMQSVLFGNGVMLGLTS